MRISLYRKSRVYTPTIAIYAYAGAKPTRSTPKSDASADSTLENKFALIYVAGLRVSQLYARN